MKLTVKGAIDMKTSDQPKITIGAPGSEHLVTFELYPPVDIEKLLKLVTKPLIITLESEEEKLTTL